MIKLDNVSLICIDCYSYGKAVSAIQKSLEQIQFEKVLFLTNIKIDLEGIEVVQIPSIRSKREYSEFVIKRLANYIHTDYFCLIQADGYIIESGRLSHEDLAAVMCRTKVWAYPQSSTKYIV